MILARASMYIIDAAQIWVGYQLLIVLDCAVALCIGMINLTVG